MSNLYNIPSLAELLSSAEATVLPNVPAASTGGSSTLSFGVVNSAANGKRLTFSKGLSHALGLTDGVYLSFIPAEKMLLLSPVSCCGQSQLCKLRTSGERKVSYNSHAVQLVTAAFELDFSGCTSMSFGQIEVQTNTDGIPIAIVKMVRS